MDPVSDSNELPPPVLYDVNITINGDVIDSVVAGVINGDTIGAAGAVATASIWRTPNIQPFTCSQQIGSTPFKLVGRAQVLKQALKGFGRGQKAAHFYGIYGVGKTRLASEVFCSLLKKRKFKDGIIWLSVERLDAASALERLGAGLGIIEVAQASSVAEKTLALQRALAHHHDLLIGLDDVSDDATARTLLEATGECPVILNGILSTGLSGRVFESQLPALDSDRAVELFGMVTGRKTADPLEMEQVRDICGLVGGLPLGIALAAGKRRDGDSLDEILETLQAAPEIFVEENPYLSAVLSANYRGLKEGDPQALALWMALASFPAYQASETWLEEDWQANGGQHALFIKARSKLLRLGLAQVSGEGRLSLHPIIGRGLLQVEREVILRLRAHTDERLLAFAVEHREPNIPNYEWIRPELTNLLALLEWYEDERQWDRLAGLLRGLFNYLRANGLWETSFRRLERLVANLEKIQDPFLRGWTLLHRGIMYLLRSNNTAAVDDFDSADRLFTAQGNLAYRGKVLYRRAQLSILSGSYREAQIQLNQALEWMGDRLSEAEMQSQPERVAPKHDRSAAHERLGFSLAETGALRKAVKEFQKAVELGEDENILRVRTALAELYRKLSQFDRAETELQMARELSLRLKDLLQQACVEIEMGYLTVFRPAHDLKQSQGYFEAARDIFERLQYRPGIARVLHALGILGLMNNLYEDARTLFQKAMDINLETGNKVNADYNYVHLGLACLLLGDLALARNILEDVLIQSRRTGSLNIQTVACMHLGDLERKEGDRAAAEMQYQRAISLAKKAGNQLLIAGLKIKVEQLKSGLDSSSIAGIDNQAILVDEPLKAFANREQNSSFAQQESIRSQIIKMGTISDAHVIGAAMYEL